MMLDADVQAAVVVDRNGAVQGLMTLERVARLMREGEHGPSFGLVGDPSEDESEVPSMAEASAAVAIGSSADPGAGSSAGPPADTGTAD